MGSNTLCRARAGGGMARSQKQVWWPVERCRSETTWLHCFAVHENRNVSHLCPYGDSDGRRVRSTLAEVVSTQSEGRCALLVRQRHAARQPGDLRR